MKTFVIADTHFGHSNIIKYCDRPFVTTEEMDRQLIEKWNLVVGKEDIVYHLGDFALGNMTKVSEYRKQLKGKIFLIQGNHDGYSIRKYYEAGFDKVYDKPIIIHDFIILSHHPMFITDIMPYANIYGHVHNNPQYTSVTGNTFCVSVERTNYTPILLDTVVSRMKEFKEKTGHKDTVSSSY